MSCSPTCFAVHHPSTASPLQRPLLKRSRPCRTYTSESGGEQQGPACQGFDHHIQDFNVGFSQRTMCFSMFACLQTFRLFHGGQQLRQAVAVEASIHTQGRCLMRCRQELLFICAVQAEKMRAQAEDNVGTFAPHIYTSHFQSYKDGTADSAARNKAERQAAAMAAPDFPDNRIQMTKSK